MKAKEIRELSPEEIRLKLNELTEEQFNLKFQHATDQLENTMRLQDVRKDIARVKTILTELELKAAGGA